MRESGLQKKNEGMLTVLP